jgi:hypothetical protein
VHLLLTSIVDMNSRNVTGFYNMPLSLCLQVLRVHVTTARVKYLRPEAESGNRVIRHFSSKKAVYR